MIYQIYHKLPQLRFFILLPSSSTLRPLKPREMGNLGRNSPFLHCYQLDHSPINHPDWEMLYSNICALCASAALGQSRCFASKKTLQHY